MRRPDPALQENTTVTPSNDPQKQNEHTPSHTPQKRRIESDNEHTPSLKKGRDQVETVQDEGHTEYANFIHRLAKECRRDSPRLPKIERLMRNTFDGRQKWIKYERPPALEVLETFPPLRQSKHVSMHIYYYVYHSQLFCQLHSLQLQTELIRVAGDGTQLGLAEDKWKEFQSKIYKQASIEAQSSAMFKTLLLNQEIEAKVQKVTLKVNMYKIQKHFQNVMLVGMASKISKNYTYKCVDCSRHNGIKGAKAKCAH